jgi:Fe-S-cluster containining protein
MPVVEDRKDGEGSLAAGDFSSWMTDLQAAIGGEQDSDVPCDGCTACCRSSQFVHIEPDETDTLAHIAPELLFPAPRLPRGHVVLGYDDDGHCPMLIDGRCSIYEHRPRTCRTYDCRVFPAAGVYDDDKTQIERQARRWRFSYPSAAGRTEHDAVLAAAAFLHQQEDRSPEWPVPTGAAQLAVLAIEVHALFLDGADGSPAVVARPDPEAVRVAITRQTGSRGAASGDGQP